MSETNTETKTDRVTVKRIAERGHYDRSVIDPIIDEAIICHVGTVEDGMPMVIPKPRESLKKRRLKNQGYRT